MFYPSPDTPTRLPLTGTLTGDTGRMTPGNNAGIKRNRRPTGTKAVEKRVVLGVETEAAFAEARLASGNLSLGLYLELLAQRLQHDLGGLPVLSPTADPTEVVHTKAA